MKTKMTQKWTVVRNGKPVKSVGFWYSKGDLLFILGRELRKGEIATKWLTDSDYGWPEIKIHPAERRFAFGRR